jgi:hypothetical protein
MANGPFVVSRRSRGLSMIRGTEERPVIHCDHCDAPAPSRPWERDVHTYLRDYIPDGHSEQEYLAHRLALEAGWVRRRHSVEVTTKRLFGLIPLYDETSRWVHICPSCLRLEKGDG